MFNLIQGGARGIGVCFIIPCVDQGFVKGEELISFSDWTLSCSFIICREKRHKITRKIPLLLLILSVDNYEKIEIRPVDGRPHSSLDQCLKYSVLQFSLFAFFAKIYIQLLNFNNEYQQFLVDFDFFLSLSLISNFLLTNTLLPGSFPQFLVCKRSYCWRLIPGHPIWVLKTFITHLVWYYLLFVYFWRKLVEGRKSYLIILKTDKSIGKTFQ